MNVVIDPEVHRTLVFVFIIVDMLLILFMRANKGKKKAYVAAAILAVSMLLSCSIFWQ